MGYKSKFMQTAFSIFLLFSSTKQMSVRDCQIWVPLKKKEIFRVLFRAPPFLGKWCGGATYFLNKKKKKKKTKYNYTRLNCSISLIE